GETFVIMGLSGSGKSTLIRHFNRLIEPTAGQILLDGTDITALSKQQLEDVRRHRMAMVFQRFALFPHRTVVENVGYALKLRGEKRAEWEKKAQYWLEIVGLDGYANQYPNQLSGGQQQRVGLARALCSDADVLLMDEAFSALDPLIRSEMQDLLIQLQSELHKTIIFITHDLDEALRLGDRIAILNDGEIVQIGAPAEILLEPADDYVEAFVRDVNRARALTVETVMKPPTARISAETVGEALAQMRGQAYAYVVEDGEYKGVACQERLEEVAESEGRDTPLCEDVLEDVPAVSADAAIETIIPDTLESDYPLPVVNEEGELAGQVSSQSLVRVLADPDAQAESAGDQASARSSAETQERSSPPAQGAA
ncbi:MAG: ATP-binding cassette domain-containing protein, partial [Gammaproteobacteria bacterium]